MIESESDPIKALAVSSNERLGAAFVQHRLCEEDDIKKGMEELTKASHKLAEEVYKQQAAKQQQGAGAAGPQPGAQAGPQQQGPQAETKTEAKEDVVDAEYKVDGEEKK